mmetsp:Transcript_13400/g.36018  ORF Transcript_13400/g.36018 Transcript_13400/m.36018 type:complete len:322 (-) Transcript_13400:1083-2048(-)
MVARGVEGAARQSGAADARACQGVSRAWRLPRTLPASVGFGGVGTKCGPRHWRTKRRCDCTDGRTKACVHGEMPQVLDDGKTLFLLSFDTDGAGNDCAALAESVRALRRASQLEQHGKAALLRRAGVHLHFWSSHPRCGLAQQLERTKHPCALAVARCANHHRLHSRALHTHAKIVPPRGARRNVETRSDAQSTHPGRISARQAFRDLAERLRKHARLCSGRQRAHCRGVLPSIHRVRSLRRRARATRSRNCVVSFRVPSAVKQAAQAQSDVCGRQGRIASFEFDCAARPGPKNFSLTHAFSTTTRAGAHRKRTDKSPFPA